MVFSGIRSYLWCMIRKSLSIVILFSLTLHCAGRTGFLSYLYKQRHEIAYALGLINEVPIAVCSASYYSHNGSLAVQTADDSAAVPTVLTNAAEIVLFFSAPEFSPAPERLLLCDDLSTKHRTGFYGSPDLDFFQPPRIELLCCTL